MQAVKHLVVSGSKKAGNIGGRSGQMNLQRKREVPASWKIWTTWKVKVCSEPQCRWAQTSRKSRWAARSEF
jgi:hypothetical protein